MSEMFKNNNNHAGLEMYFNREVARNFAELEQNDKNFRVAEIVDDVIMSEIKDMNNPLYVAELGGGAHPDRYHKLFARLLDEPRGQIDWVDISQVMLELARGYIDNDKYRERFEIISFVESDMLLYLKNQSNCNLDLVVMKYAVDFIEDLNVLFELLASRLKVGGKFVSNLTTLDPQLALASVSTNARYLYNGQEFPDDEVRILKDGDSFTIKFFKVSGESDSGYLTGAETMKYYHSEEKIRELAKKHGLNISLGDWKELLGEQEGLDQLVLVLRK